MKKTIRLILPQILGVSCLIGSLWFGGPIGGCGTQTTPAQGSPTADDFAVTSVDFTDGEALAIDTACGDLGGNNEIPELAWENAPGGTQSFAIVLLDTSTDPDTVHMVLFNILAATSSIDDTDPYQESNFAENYLGERGYAGPCPPDGDAAHTYQFTVYALDFQDLAGEVSDTTDADQVIATIQANDLASDSISGTFEAP